MRFVEFVSEYGYSEYVIRYWVFVRANVVIDIVANVVDIDDTCKNAKEYR